MGEREGEGEGEGEREREREREKGDKSCVNYILLLRNSVFPHITSYKSTTSRSHVSNNESCNTK